MKAPPAIHHTRNFDDPTPPSFACLLRHLDSLADCYGDLATEIRDVGADLRRDVEQGLTISKRRFENVVRIACQISSEDVDNHPNPSQPLQDLVKHGDDIYYDALRLSGHFIWDENTKHWENVDEVVQRQALERDGLRSRGEEGDS